MADIIRSARYAFLLLTAVNAIAYIAAVAALLSDKMGTAGYVLTIVAAPLLSPAALGLPWFDAWARDAAVSSRLLLLWGVWIISLAGLLLTSLDRLRRRRSGAA
jgi:hypothetical protein